MRISKSKRALVKSEAIYDVYKQPETVGKEEDQSYSNEINWKIRTKANHKSLFWSRCWNSVFNDEKTGKQSNNEVAKQIIAVKS